MSKNEVLIIVESPAKCKKIESYLGTGFRCIATYGHLRHLQNLNDVRISQEKIDIHFHESIDKKKVIASLKKYTKSSSRVILATDNDREGEAISWHILETMKSKKSLNNAVNVKRIAFHEITKKAITSAVQSPRTIDLKLVDAQQARRILDRLV